MHPSSELRLAIHHIGGRAGNRAFPVIPAFEQDVVNVLYDADADCLDQVDLRNRGLASELHVFPHCFAGANGPRDFYINHDPFTSSLLEPNPDFAGYHLFASGSDYLLGDAFQCREQRRIGTVTLDAVFQTAEPPVQPPDVLTLDTQGSELEILQGGTATLASHVLAIGLEVEFQPLYRQQPLFGEVDFFLREQGFVFARFPAIHELSPSRQAVGTRGRGLQAYADALFLRRPADVAARVAPGRRTLLLHKLAYLCLVYGLTEWALESLQLADDLGEWPVAADLPGYLAFAREWGEIAQKNDTFPPSFAEKFTFQRSRARFEAGAEDDAAIWVTRIAQQLKGWLEQAGHRDSELEAFTRSHGLSEQADWLWENRVAQSLHLPHLRNPLLEPLGIWALASGFLLEAWSWEEMGHRERALEAVRAILGMAPELRQERPAEASLTAVYGMGNALRKWRESALADELYRCLLEVIPKEAPFRDRLGGCHFHLGELALAAHEPIRAREHYHLCLEHVPTHGKARERLAEIQG